MMPILDILDVMKEQTNLLMFWYLNSQVYKKPILNVKQGINSIPHSIFHHIIIVPSSRRTCTTIQ